MVRGFRVADGRWPLFDAQGASRVGGRWNPPGVAVIYAAGSYAGALLEQLVRLGWGAVPPHYVAAEILVPEGVVVERPERIPPGWDAPDDCRVARAVGLEWLGGGRAAVLDVPSVTARPHERTLVLNPAHPDFRRVRLSDPVPVEWDPRLFLRDGA